MRVVALMLASQALLAGGEPRTAATLVATAAADSAEARFLRDLDTLTAGGGRWLADNSAYVSPEEPWRTYGLEWKKGPSNRTGHGRLFGIEADGSERDFWEFFTYWDPGRQAAVAIQVHTSGAGLGMGDMTWSGDDAQELVQTFRWADGSTQRVKHVERSAGDERHSESFDWADGAWQPRRTYVWKRDTRDPGVEDAARAGAPRDGMVTAPPGAG